MTTSKYSVLLFDHGLNGLAMQMRLRGYTVQEATRLADAGMKIKSDYSLIRYAVDYDMVLITNDREVMLSCKENDIPCVLIPVNHQMAVPNTLGKELEEKYGILPKHSQR